MRWLGLFTKRTFRKHRKLFVPHMVFIICIVPLAIFHPHFSIGIFSSAIFHPHFSIRQPPLACVQPPAPLKRNRGGTLPDFFCGERAAVHRLTAIRRHPVLTLQRPCLSCYVSLNQRRESVRLCDFRMVLTGV